MLESLRIGLFFALVTRLEVSLEYRRIASRIDTDTLPYDVTCVWAVEFRGRRKSARHDPCPQSIFNHIQHQLIRLRM